MDAPWNFISHLAEEIGFHLIRFTSAALKPESFRHYEQWVTNGRAGEMTYMSRDTERRRSAKALLPNATTVICLGVNYYRTERTQDKRVSSSTGQVARYAYGRDYHKVIEKMLKRLVRELRTHYPDERFKACVDTSAVLERAYAQQSGMGFIGKNTTLITPELGSWIFLCEVLTTLSIDAKNRALSRSEGDGCGHCRLCLDICPTGALVGPYELDAPKCISYLTIEHRGSIPIELRPLMGDWLYGCDLCQEICPHNVRAQATDVEELVAQRIGGDYQKLEDILKLDTDDAFNAYFAGSPMRRAKREGLVRNACIVAANVNAAELLPLLQKLACSDSSEIVREHAAWAVEALKNRRQSPVKLLS